MQTLRNQTVLILGNPQDEHARFVYQKVLERGLRADFFDTLAFPQQATLSLSLPENTSDRQGWKIAASGGQAIAAEDVRAIYWRNFNGLAPEPSGIEDPMQAYIAREDTRSLLESALADFPCRWVNGWEGYQMHQRKPASLRRVAAMGVPIPKSVITNDPEEVRIFLDEHDLAIFKPVQGGAHTQRISSTSLSPENLEILKICPVTIQEEVAGTNVRVFVAGDRAFACEVKTDEVDFRDDPEPKIHAIDLPTDLAQQSQAIAKELGLVWSGIDYRLSPDGRFVFLEANPSPMFLGFEAATGQPIAEALVDLLVS